MCYNTRMESTTNNPAETTRTCCYCGSEEGGCAGRLSADGYCEECVAEAIHDAQCDEPTATGYEGDEDPYWEQRAEG